MEERTGTKSKGNMERYIQFKCRVPKENNKRRKTRDLFRKTGNVRGAFHPKTCTIKDENCRALVDNKVDNQVDKSSQVHNQVEIKIRQKEHIEELYKKFLMNQITMIMWLVTQC